MESNSKLRSTLNGLIETCKDGQEGFRTAAENVDDAGIKQLFNEYALQRSKFAGELQAAAQTLGEHDPEDTSSVAGALHRGWINLKAAVAGNDRYAILAECERGEDSAVAEYKKALELVVPGNIQEIIQRQYVDVQAAHDRVKALRDAGK